MFRKNIFNKTSKKSLNRWNLGILYFGMQFATT